MNHEDYMRLALSLAQQTNGQTAPNPVVGAVCVKQGELIGLGVHTQAGTPHAEVHALTMAGSAAKDADLYVTLEPCCHVGKTPPCTELIIQSGIRRVFVASIDPHPVVAGAGIKLLRDAGIEVIVGLLQEEAIECNRAFFHFIQHQRPYVTLKAAVTLDGRLATAQGDSQWITSAASRQDVHLLRHTHDAILVGVQTILQDNPFLTTRLPHGGKNPIRVILDRHLRTPKDAHVLTDQAAKTILYTLPPAQQIDVYRAIPGVSVEVIDESLPFLDEVLKHLAKNDIMKLLVEGGSQVHTSFIQQELADELYLYMAAKLIGNGPLIFSDAQRHFMHEAKKLTLLDVKKIDNDLRLHVRFNK